MDNQINTTDWLDLNTSNPINIKDEESIKSPKPIRPSKTSLELQYDANSSLDCLDESHFMEVPMLPDINDNITPELIYDNHGIEEFHFQLDGISNLEDSKRDNELETIFKNSNKGKGIVYGDQNLTVPTNSNGYSPRKANHQHQRFDSGVLHKSQNSFISRNIDNHHSEQQSKRRNSKYTNNVHNNNNQPNSSIKPSKINPNRRYSAPDHNFHPDLSTDDSNLKSSMNNNNTVINSNPHNHNNGSNNGVNNNNHANSNSRHHDNSRHKKSTRNFTSQSPQPVVPSALLFNDEEHSRMYQNFLVFMEHTKRGNNSQTPQWNSHILCQSKPQTPTSSKVRIPFNQKRMKSPITSQSLNWVPRNSVNSSTFSKQLDYFSFDPNTHPNLPQSSKNTEEKRNLAYVVDTPFTDDIQSEGGVSMGLSISEGGRTGQSSSNNVSRPSPNIGINKFGRSISPVGSNSYVRHSLSGKPPRPFSTGFSNDYTLNGVPSWLADNTPNSSRGQETANSNGVRINYDHEKDDYKIIRKDYTAPKYAEVSSLPSTPKGQKSQFTTYTPDDKSFIGKDLSDDSSDSGRASPLAGKTDNKSRSISLKLNPESVDGKYGYQRGKQNKSDLSSDYAPPRSSQTYRRRSNESLESSNSHSSVLVHQNVAHKNPLDIDVLDINDETSCAAVTASAAEGSDGTVHYAENVAEVIQITDFNLKVERSASIISEMAWLKKMPEIEKQPNNLTVNTVFTSGSTYIEPPVNQERKKRPSKFSLNSVLNYRRRSNDESNTDSESNNEPKTLFNGFNSYNENSEFPNDESYDEICINWANEDNLKYDNELSNVNMDFSGDHKPPLHPINNENDHFKKKKQREKHFATYVLRKFFRIPSRYLSLRNVVALMNVVIIAVVILVITVFGVISFNNSVKAALKTLGEVALRLVAFNIVTVMERAESRTIGLAKQMLIMNSVTLERNIMPPTSMACASYMWQTAKTDSVYIGDQLFLVNDEGAFCGVSFSNPVLWKRFSNQIVNSVPNGAYLRILNGTAPSTRSWYALNGTAALSCNDANNYTCVNNLLTSIPAVQDIDNPTQEPYFSLGYESSPQTQLLWTSIYDFGSGDGFGITNVVPIRLSLATGFNFSTSSPTSPDYIAQSQVLALAGVNVRLESLANFVSDGLAVTLRNFISSSSKFFVNALSHDIGSIEFLVIDLATNYVVISTCDDNYDNSTDANAFAPLSPVQPKSTLSPVVSTSVYYLTTVSSFGVTVNELRTVVMTQTSTVGSFENVYVTTNFATIPSVSSTTATFLIETTSTTTITSTTTTVPEEEKVVDATTTEANPSASTETPYTFGVGSESNCVARMARKLSIDLDDLPEEAIIFYDNSGVLYTPYTEVQDSVIMIASRFTPRDGIEWAVIGRIPKTYFDLDVIKMFGIATPIVSAVILILATIFSFYVTRALGKPLKDAAEKMMRIADLNFDNYPDEQTQLIDYNVKPEFIENDEYSTFPKGNKNTENEIPDITLNRTFSDISADEMRQEGSEDVLRESDATAYNPTNSTEDIYAVAPISMKMEKDITPNESTTTKSQTKNDSTFLTKMLEPIASIKMWFVNNTSSHNIKEKSKNIISKLAFNKSENNKMAVMGPDGSIYFVDSKKKKKINTASLSLDDDNEYSFELKEIRLLNKAMDSMTSGLKSFSKYVPLDVVSLLVKMKREAILGVDEMCLTIFFSDIANFTTIAESMSPKLLVGIMSEYLNEMSNIILESGGVVDKYIGDAVMAFWNAPLYVKDHASIACSVALRSQQRLAFLREQWIRQGLPAIFARMGLNTGQAFVGNLGSPTRLNYTCLGDAVNLASRLEGLNKRYKTNIIISDAVHDSVQNKFVMRPLDHVAVKGKTVSRKCYELLCSVANADESLIRMVEIYTDAFESYCCGEFDYAAELFTKFLDIYPGDVPAKQHLENCKKFGDLWRNNSSGENSSNSIKGDSDRNSKARSSIAIENGWTPVVFLDEK